MTFLLNFDSPKTPVEPPTRYIFSPPFTPVRPYTMHNPLSTIPVGETQPIPIGSTIRRPARDGAAAVFSRRYAVVRLRSRARSIQR